MPHPLAAGALRAVSRDIFITTHSHTVSMASLARTSMLRQATLLSRRSISTSTTAIRASSFLRPTTVALLRQSPLMSRLAPFSSTAKTQILPPGPQVIHGGVNDPAPVPKSSPTHGSYHWTFERLLAVAIIPLTIAPFAAGHVNAAVDAALVFTILLHSHIGFQWVHPHGTQWYLLMCLQSMCDRLLSNMATSHDEENLRLDSKHCYAAGGLGLLRIRDERCWPDGGYQESLACRCSE